MPVYRCIWHDQNVEHLAEHGITIEEFESVIGNPIRTKRSRTSDRLVAFGYVSDGRKLACVYEKIDELTVLPVTAYEVE